MTNYPLHNFPAFDRARDLLKEMGHEVVSPADIDRSMGITEHTPFEECQKQMKSMLRADVLAIIDQCNGMYMLMGWEKSTGARAEHALAVWMGIPIFYEMALPPPLPPLLKALDEVSRDWGEIGPTATDTRIHPENSQPLS